MTTDYDGPLGEGIVQPTTASTVVRDVRLAWSLTGQVGGLIAP